MHESDDRADQQLAAIGEVSRVFEREPVGYGLIGGWAVDFHAGAVTRPHDDVDLAIWRADVARVTSLLERTGRRHAPDEDEDGGTGFERGAVRLELTFLVRDEGGSVYTPLENGRTTWSPGALANDVRQLHSVQSRVLALDSLAKGKSKPRDDRDDAAKDRADSTVLGRIER